MQNWPVFFRRFAARRLARYDRPTLISLFDPSRSCDLRRRFLRFLVKVLGPNETFSLIYEKNLWGTDESRSGAGSTLAQTASIRDFLPRLLQDLEIRSLLDIPCGDFNWMRQLDLSGIRYVGADIVPELISENARAYGSQDRQFVCLDLLSDRLPRADAVLCRDCLVHLPNADAARALENIRSSGAAYLLATTFPSLELNEDVVLGFWRPLNLERPPFSLPPARMLLNEGNPDPRYADKSLGIWCLNDRSDTGVYNHER